MGRRRGELQDNGAHQALSLLEPGALQAASSRNCDFQSLYNLPASAGSG
jgi:hypothetical protein